MLTNNWYTAFKANMTYSSYTNTSDGMNLMGTTGRPSSVRNTNDNKPLLFPNINYNLVTNNSSGGVVLGNGTTPPDKNDYWLSGEQFTTLNQVSASVSVETDGDKSSFVVTYVVSNTGTNAFTVSEIGWVAKQQYDNYSNYSSFLFDRTLLESPITIPANGLAQITYKRSINLPISYT